MKSTFFAAMILAASLTGCTSDLPNNPNKTRANPDVEAAKDVAGGPTPPSTARPEMSERDKLIQKLVARGDQAIATDKKNCAGYNAYEFACIYSPIEVSINEKLKTATKPDQGGIISFDALERLRDIGNETHAQCLSPWEPRHGNDIEITELRILVSQELTGDLQAKAGTCREGIIETNLMPRSSPFREERGGELVFFIHRPKMTTEQIRLLLGRPDSETKDKQTVTALTYGRFRIALDENGNTIAVFFVPYEPGPTAKGQDPKAEKGTEKKPPEISDITIETAKENAEKHKGKWVKWEGAPIKMDRDEENKTISFLLLNNKGTAKNVAEMKVFAVKCDKSELTEIQIIEFGTADRLSVIGRLAGLDAVEIKLADGAAEKRKVPLLTNPSFERTK